MNTNSLLQLGSIEAVVVRKQVKNLHLSVLPPSGWVRVTAPERMNDDAIRTLLASRLPWIKKQQKKFVSQERQYKREYVSGESHYYLGKRYRLELIYKDVTPRVSFKNKSTIILQVRPHSSVEKREEIMTEWYRRVLFPIVDAFISKWQKKIGVEVKFWGIKRMKTRWGTCNQKNARILINLELAKKPIPYIEYVVVHELLHLIERKHNEKFIVLMTKHLPKWQSMKEELNSFMLSYEDWNY